MRKTSLNKPLIRFRRWSQKKYAMFASIGKCVTIGNVTKGIADASLGKQGNCCASSSAAWSMLTESVKEVEEDDTGPVPDALLLLLQMLLQPQKSVEVNCCSYINHSIYGRTYIPKGICARLFLCLN